jgi:anti-sigma regulatory factor (Ser/Thr protein kinase)
MDKPFSSHTIEERSFVSFLKREIHSEVGSARFTSKQVAEIDIIVSEITSNLIKHAGRGEILFRINPDTTHDTFEIMCFDNGPGIQDTLRMRRDGVSTTNTLGQGLGAIDRLSNFFQLYSLRDWGTIVHSRVGASQSKTLNAAGLEIRGLNVCKPRETVSGDGHFVKKTKTGAQILFADGLGHGPQAKESVDRAFEQFSNSEADDPVEIIREIHSHVRRTRGLVASIAVWHNKQREWKICGVGNILNRMYTGIVYKNYLSYNGTIGLNIPSSMKPSVVEGERNQHLIMCSDGIRSRWDITRYPAIHKYDLTMLAGAIYKDYVRGNDDASILIVKVL